MSDVKETAPITREAAAKFMIECARYFDMEPTRNEDSAHWASVSNAQTCRRIAAMLAAAPPPAEALPSQTSGAEAVGYMRPQDNDGKSFWCSRQRNAYYSEPVYLAKPASEPAGGGVREANWREMYAREAHKVMVLQEEVSRLSSPASPSPAEAEALPAGVDDIKAAWGFLQDRLLEFEQEIGSGEEEREWAGHVHPALVRFNRLIAALTSAPVQEDQT